MKVKKINRKANLKDCRVSSKPGEELNGKAEYGFVDLIRDALRF